MAMIQFTHVGKAIVAVNPELVFSIECFGLGSVGAYTRIRSTGDAHVDVKESFAVVVERLGMDLINFDKKPTAKKGEQELSAIPETTEAHEGQEDTPPRAGFSWDQ